MGRGGGAAVARVAAAPAGGTASGNMDCETMFTFRYDVPGKCNVYSESG